MTELPSGAVTFLFTDIEGSTRLVKQLRERYGDVLREHQRLLRAAFEAHGGHEVDTQGDSFFIAFTSARDALLAAVEGQRALLTHTWPDGVVIKVRMGLHTGQAIASGGRYTGLAVHRAARIGAAGHGGQILVSQATQTLLEDEEEELGVVLRDLGEQRLKDLDRPVCIYQAVADGLPAEFAPLGRDAEPAPVEPASRPLWRHPAALVAALFAFVALIAGATAALAFRGEAASVTVLPNQVALIDPETGRVVDAIQVGTRPDSVAAGGGSVWVGNLDDKTVTRIDARRRTVLRHIPLDNRTPTGLAFGFGALWVAHGRLGQLSQIDPQFDEVSSPIEVGGTAFGSPDGVVAVDQQSVWAAFGDSTLARIDPTTARVAEQTRAGSVPAGIAVDSGSVWVANSGDSTVMQYRTETFTEGPLRTFNVGRRPTGIAAQGGASWVASTADDSVRWIDPDAGDRPISVGKGPTAVAVGADAVWVANTAAGTVSRIDPETNEVGRTIEVGNAPAGIVFADGFLWVSVQAP
jgi:YVTN family beta-propeller protein